MFSFELIQKKKFLVQHQMVITIQIQKCTNQCRLAISFSIARLYRNISITTFPRMGIVHDIRQSGYKIA